MEQGGVRPLLDSPQGESESGGGKGGGGRGGRRKRKERRGGEREGRKEEGDSRPAANFLVSQLARRRRRFGDPARGSDKIRSDKIRYRLRRKNSDTDQTRYQPQKTQIRSDGGLFR